MSSFSPIESATLNRSRTESGEIIPLGGIDATPGMKIAGFQVAMTNCLVTTNRGIYLTERTDEVKTGYQ